LIIEFKIKIVAPIKAINPTGNSPCGFYGEVVAPAGYFCPLGIEET
jgi:hypothetical protein